MELRLHVARYRRARPRAWKTIEAPRGIAAALRVVKERKETSLMVTNELGRGLAPENELARHYRDTVGRVNQGLAAQAEGGWYVARGVAQPPHELALPAMRDESS